MLIETGRHRVRHADARDLERLLVRLDPRQTQHILNQ